MPCPNTTPPVRPFADTGSGCSAELPGSLFRTPLRAVNTPIFAMFCLFDGSQFVQVVAPLIKRPVSQLVQKQKRLQEHESFIEAVLQISISLSLIQTGHAKQCRICSNEGF